MQTCACERQQDSSVGQALHLNNGHTLNDKLRGKGSRVEAWLAGKVGDEEAVRRIYLLALSRPPSDAELSKFKALLAEAAKDGTATRRDSISDFSSVQTPFFSVPKTTTIRRTVRIYQAPQAPS